MGFDDCYLLGQLVKTHGLRGEMIANLDVDYPEEYKNLESVFIDQNGKLVPFFLESISVQSSRAYVAFEDIENVDEASTLVGMSLYLPLDELPKLSDGKYYFHQLVGLTLMDGQDVVGPVNQIYDLPNNRLLGVDYKGTEVLIPLSEGIIQKVDVKGKEISAQLPDGLLDVFSEG
ncbi:MAG: 16S rRNA processing protein RimM [Cyclobacteriaceae bacterium]